MTRARWTVGLLVACALLACSTAPAPQGELISRAGDPDSLPEMESRISAILARGHVPGLSVVILDDSQVAYANTFGVKNHATGEPLDAETIFTAASFSKTVFAYLVMLLVEDGLLDLDRPLIDYLERPLPDYPNYADLEGDERYRRITARMCLSHTTGFPNWRWFTDDRSLQFLSDPGERHGYSGEGIQLLQLTIEELTGRDLESLARERIFEPLGMTRSGYVWQAAWADNLALPHDRYRRPKRYAPRKEPQAAGSMATTAGDYAKFLVALLDTDDAVGPSRASIDEMLKMQATNRHAGMFGPRYFEESDEFANAGWGLGFGRFDCDGPGRAIFHTGHDDGAQNYTVTFVDRGIGVVLLSNSDNFEAVSREILEVTIGDRCSPLDWVGYPRFDPDELGDPPPAPVGVLPD